MSQKWICAVQVAKQNITGYLELRSLYLRNGKIWDRNLLSFIAQCSPNVYYANASIWLVFRLM